MSRRSVLIGRGSMATALAGAFGATLYTEPAPGPTLTRNGLPLDFAPEQALRERLQSTQTINEFREMLRQSLPQSPEIRSDMMELAVRFSAHEGYPKLVSLLDKIRDEMDHPEFDFGDPQRLSRWINYMFNRKTDTPESTR